MTAAGRFFDAKLLIPLAAALLVGTAAFVVMRLYMRAVFRESQIGSRFPEACDMERDAEKDPAGSQRPSAASLEIRKEAPTASRNGRPPLSPTFRYASAAFRRASFVYALGALSFAAVSVGLLLRFGYTLPPTPSRLTMWGCIAGLFWSWCLPGAFVLALFWGPDRRLRLLLLAVYVGALPAVGALLQLAGAPPLPFDQVAQMSKEEMDLLLSFASSVTGQPVTVESVTFSPFLEPVLFWSLSAAPVLIVFVAFNRVVRGTVGPLFVNTALFIVLLSLLAMDVVLGTRIGIRFVIGVKRVFGGATLGVLYAIGLALSSLVAWNGLRWIAERYRRKRLSDQMFLFDGLFLSMSTWLCVLLTTHTSGYLIGLLPFVAYRTVIGVGLTPLTARAEPLPKSRLLFLRVFGSPARSERLLDLLSSRWRYAGSIQLISATDVARARFEPDEFLDFLGSRLASGYIRNDADLERHMADLDLRTDPDGRCRINEFFCHADTWKPTVRRLMSQSDLVAMDLRAFTSAKAGATFELGVLLEAVPLGRVALLIDQTTDESSLKRTLAELWRNVSVASPNARAGAATVRIIDLAHGYPAAVRLLMQRGDEILASTA